DVGGRACLVVALFCVIGSSGLLLVKAASQAAPYWGLYTHSPPREGSASGALLRGFWRPSLGWPTVALQVEKNRKAPLRDSPVDGRGESPRVTLEWVCCRWLTRP